MTSRPLAVLRTLGLIGLITIVPVRAGASPFSEMGGHLGFGYAKLFATDAPGGSMAAAAGLDLPVTTDLRAGLEAGIDLLGSSAFERGSLLGEVDYSVFELLGQVHWKPSWRGPVGRLSIGPGLFKAKADLNSSGPAAFEDLPVNEWGPGVAGSVTFISRKPSKVSAGLELGGRWIALSKEDWSLFNARLVIHY
jgi:hypothetical protein